MKNRLLIWIAVLSGINSFAQSTEGNGNNWIAAPLRYLGYNATNGVQPLFIRTNLIDRIRLNGNQAVTINGINQAVNGYLGLSPNGYFSGTNSPWAMLHLEGPNSSGLGGNGWRSWMRTGMLVRDETDHIYVGMKNEGSNRSDAIINWSDDANDVDKLRFLFTGKAGSGNGDDTNPLNGAGLNGYEFMRMQTIPTILNEVPYPVGHVGIGPLFTDVLTPQNRLHINAESGLPTYMQITNVAGGSQPGTGQTALDGLKLGMEPVLNGGAQRQYGFLQWQENTPFVVQTDWDGTAGGVTTGERLRVTSVGALVNTETNTYGGLTTPTNVTRIGVSYNGSAPVTKPLSLMHLGYNGVGSSAGGWRPWMDIGTFTSNGLDHVYIGLKQEGTSITADRMDAIVGWGDNHAGATGPDNIRFIFTSATGGTVPATGANGLEGMRMTPTPLEGIFTGIGGDPIANPYGPAVPGTNPTATLEVNSWGTTSVTGGSSGLRFTNLTTTSPTLANPGPGVLAVDDEGDVIYVPGGTSNFGATCNDNATNVFSEDRKVNLNDNSFYFVGNNINNNENNVGFGWACGTPLKAKVDAISYGTGGLAGNFLTFENWIDGVNSLTPTGVNGLAAGDGNGSASYYGVFGQALGSNHNGNFGVYGSAPSAANSYAGYFNGDVHAVGVFTSSDRKLKNDIKPIEDALAIVNQLSPKTYYMDSKAYPDFNFSNELQYGFIAQEVQAVLPSLVKQTVQPGSFDKSGKHTANPTAYLALNYNAIIPINTQAIIELNQKVESRDATIAKQQTTIDDLNTRLTKLEKCLSGILPSLCQMSQSIIETNDVKQQEQLHAQLSIKLLNRGAIVLDQNVPNPFSEQTVINFSIPESVQKAQILFYNPEGKMIQSVNVSERGLGSLTVFGSDLSGGLYTYTLVADGQIVATKKMIKQ
jgi:hypothetical protein